MKPIFILNAPPQTGKDTIANELLDKTESGLRSFKAPMFSVFCSTVGLDYSVFEKLYNTQGWKDSPQEITNGRTPRELMIHISENYVKPFFGEDYYGKATADSIKQHEERYSERAWVIPDGGFQGEFDAFKEIHGDRVVLVQLYREGHETFAGDSRNWVYDWKKYPEEGAVVFDTTKGNENVINFIVEKINES